MQNIVGTYFIHLGIWGKKKAFLLASSTNIYKILIDVFKNIFLFFTLEWHQLILLISKYTSQLKSSYTIAYNFWYDLQRIEIFTRKILIVQSRGYDYDLQLQNSWLLLSCPFFLASGLSFMDFRVNEPDQRCIKGSRFAELHIVLKTWLMFKKYIWKKPSAKSKSIKGQLLPLFHVSGWTKKAELLLTNVTTPDSVIWAACGNFHAQHNFHTPSPSITWSQLTQFPLMQIFSLP